MSSKEIWKYQLAVTDEQTLRLPYGAQILSVQVQSGIPCIWALVDTDDDRVTHRRFQIVGTGNPADHVADSRFIGTFQLHGGILVFHLFEA